MDQATQKDLLRKQLRLQRSQLDGDFCQSASEQIAQHLSKLPLIQNARHLAAYWPARNECDPFFLIKHLNLSQTYLPVVNEHNKLLAFYPYQPGEELHLNRFKIPEPCIENKKPVDIQQLDIVLVPLLGFDLQGTRLGMGGGFYDHSFAFLNGTKRAYPTQLIGLAYELQKCHDLPKDSWDVKLDFVVTEKQVYTF